VDFGALGRSGLVPYIEGFFHADGTVREIDYDGQQLSWFELGPPFTPDWEYDADDLVDVDWADRAALARGQGSVCCGEGPMGADGFFARLDPDDVPVWVVFMTDSNPLLHVRVDGMVASFTNNLDRTVRIDLGSRELSSHGSRGRRRGV
jgi:hypothetical protein